MRKRIGMFGGRVVWFDGAMYRVFFCCVEFKELAHAIRAIDEGVL